MPLRVSLNGAVQLPAHQWQKSEEMMKNVSGSFQYFSRIPLMGPVLFAEPTMRGTSLTSSRLRVSSEAPPSGWNSWPFEDMPDVRQVHLQRVFLFVHPRPDLAERPCPLELFQRCA